MRAGLPKEYVRIGYISKIHGVKGEPVLHLELPCKLPKYLFVSREGTYVPYEVLKSRGEPQRPILSLRYITEQQAAAALVGLEVFVDQEELEPAAHLLTQETELPVPYIGYTLKDIQGEIVGHIQDIKDIAYNPLFLITTPSHKEAYVPYVREWIRQEDAAQKVLIMELPDGLLDL